MAADGHYTRHGNWVFAQGEILQVLFFSVLFAFGLQALGERGKLLLV